MAGKLGSNKPGGVVAGPQKVVAQPIQTKSGGGNTPGQQAASNVAAITGRTDPTPGFGQVAQGAADAGINNETLAIMRQTGSTNPADPYNWAGIAAGLRSQNDGTGMGGGGGSSLPQAPPAAIPTPSVYETPGQLGAPSIQAPSAITNVASGTGGGPTGQTFQSSGNGGTFGMFDRKRNARSPRTGTSVTPELLRQAAQARMGSM